MLLQTLLALVVTFASAPAAPSSKPMELIDLTPQFEQAWDKSAALPDQARVAAFRAEFDKTLPGFYEAKRAGVSREKYDPFLLQGLKDFADQRAGVDSLRGRFGGIFHDGLSTFEAEFGPMTGYKPIYLVVSLGEFDGGTRDLADGSHLMFGADVIARIHTAETFRPFFHHELFHLYHARHFVECREVWCNLWSEGMAVYVASRLNPGASDKALLLTSPEPLRAAVEGHRTEAVCAVVSRLHSKDRKDHAPLFFGDPKIERAGPDLPPRFAYYVGYLAAAELGKTRSLHELADMPAQEVEPLLEKTLRDMAACPA